MSDLASYSKKRREKWKMEVLIHYGGNPPKCICCGEKIIEFLTIDHIHGSGNQHRKESKKIGSNFYYWLIKNNFPDGYQVLCWNCNCGRAQNNGICPHKNFK